MFLIEYIKKYKVTYISVVVAFIIGICIGVFVAFKMPKQGKADITSYLQDTTQMIENKTIDKKAFFKEKLLENWKDCRNNMASGLHSYCRLYNLYFSGL